MLNYGWKEASSLAIYRLIDSISFCANSYWGWKEGAALDILKNETLSFVEPQAVFSSLVSLCSETLSTNLLFTVKSGYGLLSKRPISSIDPSFLVKIFSSCL